MLQLKINATASTNSFLKDFIANNSVEEECAVIAAHQTAGRGQSGNSWYSQKYKSLTISVFKKNSCSLAHAFSISMAISLAVKNTLDLLGVPKITAKWPNDILSANKKIAGILIENMVRDHKIYGSIIGIGINVNEEELPGLPQAVSMKMATGLDFEVEDVFNEVLRQLEAEWYFLETEREKLKERYEEYLYGKDAENTFQTQEGILFKGIIKGVSELGKLQVEKQPNVVSEFDIKEVKQLL